jgi:outer membrane protein TolC
VELANQRYRSGMVDFLIVLDAERTQLAVEDQLAQSQTRTATAPVAVYKALGGGWEIERQTAAAAQTKQLHRAIEFLISFPPPLCNETTSRF